MTNDQKRENFLNKLNQICGEENTEKWLSTKHLAFQNRAPQELIDKNEWEPLEDMMTAIDYLVYE